MDIHKPKPWHGLRGLLREYAIIVLGVLTALAGEQLVETLHWDRQVEIARDSLREEMRADLLSASERLMVEDCLRTRLVELDAKLVRPGPWAADIQDNARNPGPVGGGVLQLGLPPVYRAPRRLWVDAAWQAAVTTGSFSHIPNAELKLYGALYQEIGDLRRFQDQEWALTTDIQPLAYDQTLDAAQRIAFETRIAGLDKLNASIATTSAQFIERARRNGLSADGAAVRNLSEKMARLFGTCTRQPGATADALPPGGN